MTKSGIEAGSAFVRLGLDPTKFNAGIKAAQAKLAASARSIGTIGKSLTAFGGLAAAPFVVAVKQASDFQEVMNKFNVVFGENSKGVKSWSDDFAKNIGRSKLQIAEMLAETQDLLKPMGFATDAATAMSKQVAQLAIDLASFNNKADDDVLLDLKAALTGSGEVMKKYGVIVSQATVNQELLNQNLDPKAATEAEKAQARLNIIMRGTTDAQGDAARSSGSFANILKALQAKLSDTAVTVGTALLPTIEHLAGVLKDVIGSVGKWVTDNQELVPLLAGVAAGVVVAGVAATGLAVAMTGLSAAMGLVGTAATLMTGPVGIAAVLIGGLGLAALAAGTDFEELGDQIGTAVADIKAAFENGGMESAWQAIWITMVETALTAIANILDGLQNLETGFFDSKFGQVLAAASPATAGAIKIGGGALGLAADAVRGQANDAAAARSDIVAGGKLNGELDERRATSALVKLTSAGVTGDNQKLVSELQKIAKNTDDTKRDLRDVLSFQ